VCLLEKLSALVFQQLYVSRNRRLSELQHYIPAQCPFHETCSNVIPRPAPRLSFQHARARAILAHITSDMPDVYTRGSAAPGGRLVRVCPAANRVLLEWLAASKLQHSVAPNSRVVYRRLQEGATHVEGAPDPSQPAQTSIHRSYSKGTSRLATADSVCAMTLSRLSFLVCLSRRQLDEAEGGSECTGEEDVSTVACSQTSDARESFAPVSLVLHRDLTVSLTACSRKQRAASPWRLSP
jgi:hypothetical protein